MRRRLLAGFVLFALALVVGLEVPLGLSLARNDRTTAMSEVQRDASSLAVLVAAELDHAGGPGLQDVVDQFARADGAVVAVASAGHLLAAAGKGAGEELSEARTNSIVAAAAAGHVSGEEGSNDPDDDMLYVAQPVAAAAGMAAGGASSRGSDVVLLVAEAAGPLHSRIRTHWITLALFGLGVVAVATALGMILSWSLTRPLEGIEAAVAAVGAGRLSERAPDGRGPTELRALGATVNEMADRLEELVHTQRAFLADASHQLRTPLTALRLRLENLEDGLQPSHRGDLSAALGEADRLSRIVDGLLTLARAEGGVRPAREPIEVEVALRERAEAWTALAEERQVSIESPAAPGQEAPIRALACPGHLEQILDNLLANALEATPAGGRVSLRAVRTGARVELHVVDDGPGMTAADRTRAFDRFWRQEGASKGGTGLGLAIVAQLARMSGGTAWLDASGTGGVDAVVGLDASDD